MVTMNGYRTIVVGTDDMEERMARLRSLQG